MNRIKSGFVAAGLALTFLTAAMAQDPAPSNAAAGSASVTADRIADLERVLLKKLRDIEDRLDRLERDRKSTESTNERKNDQMQRDIADIKRTTERVERTVQRLDTKR